MGQPGHTPIEGGVKIAMEVDGRMVYLTETADPNKCENCIYTKERDSLTCPKYHYAFNTRTLCDVLGSHRFHFTLE